MSDKAITLENPKARAEYRREHTRDQDHTLINARLQWVADLVCAILNAQNKRPSALVKRPPAD